MFNFESLNLKNSSKIKLSEKKTIVSLIVHHKINFTSKFSLTRKTVFISFLKKKSFLIDGVMFYY